MSFRRRRKAESRRKPFAVGEKYGEYELVQVSQIDQLLDSAIPTVTAYVEEQSGWSREGRALLKAGLAREIGIDAELPLARQLVVYASEYGYASRRFEEEMLEHEDRHAPQLTYLITGWAVADPDLTAWDLIHRAAIGFALHLNTDATGTLSFLMLPGVNREARLMMQKKTIQALLGVFGGHLRGGVTASQVVQAWEHGFVERYAEMSMPALPGVEYGDFPPQVPPADLASPPDGVRPAIP